MTKVKVTANQDGDVIVTSESNPEYGYIRVEQAVREFTSSGFLRKSVRSALIKGKVEELKELGYKKDQELEGRIVVKETLVQPNPENPEQDLKYAGDTGVPCTLDGQPIYRTTFYTTNLDEADEFIAHTNGDDIRKAQAELRSGATASM